MGWEGDSCEEKCTMAGFMIFWVLVVEKTPLNFQNWDVGGFWENVRFVCSNCKQTLSSGQAWFLSQLQTLTCEIQWLWSNFNFTRNWAGWRRPFIAKPSPVCFTDSNGLKWLRAMKLSKPVSVLWQQWRVVKWSSHCWPIQWSTGPHLNIWTVEHLNI